MNLHRTFFILIHLVLEADGRFARSRRYGRVREETKSLEELYAEAIAEGGDLLVYHGGDLPDAEDAVANAFRKAFPQINITIVVDYSKYHDARVDYQLETDTLIADIVALQTVQDYPRWKREGQLLYYKPAGFSAVYDGFKDVRDGAWFSHVVYTFSYFYDTELLAAEGLQPPATAEDLADPQYTNLIASSYPHDDDASLFVYARYVDYYGWEWVKRFADRQVEFNRGSNTPREAVASKHKAIGLAGSAPGGIDTVRVMIGPNATSPYLSWGQRMAILRRAPHPAAAKLFANWIISLEVQTTLLAGLSTRTDIPTPPGTLSPWQIRQANSLCFQRFMEDRANIERLKAIFALHFGEVRGEPTPGQLGLYPGLITAESAALNTTLHRYFPIPACNHLTRSD
ncbi:hypothetical protein FOZ60_001143 [Perkinsus olseni]|uniref:Uncharacterized protein n=1 Tax=Perkinsus olseni TaxID=32597 RepID=A0A7J6P0Y9_PEROL|nr:hypothetical protein FOZ60_001143 [Perkinsus olseni]